MLNSAPAGERGKNNTRGNLSKKAQRITEELEDRVKSQEIGAQTGEGAGKSARRYFASGKRAAAVLYRSRYLCEEFLWFADQKVSLPLFLSDNIAVLFFFFFKTTCYCCGALDQGVLLKKEQPVRSFHSLFCFGAINVFFLKEGCVTHHRPHPLLKKMQSNVKVGLCSPRSHVSPPLTEPRSSDILST